MTREEAIQFLDNIKHAEVGRAIGKDGFYAELIGYHVEALNMAIKALENIGHLTDRPCDVCEFHKENGCSKWTCVFTDKLFGDMR